MVRLWAAAVLVFLISFVGGCLDGQIDPPAALDDVSVTDKGTYYEVVLDFTRGATHREIGRAYGLKIQELVPDFEKTVDSYISEVTFVSPVYQLLLSRMRDIRPQVDEDYREEIEGLASVFSGGNGNFAGDGKVSVDEAYLVNLMGDVWRVTECCGISVYGARSATGGNMTARLFDWSGGMKNQLTKIPAVTIIKNGPRSVCLIGYLGFMATIAGFNPSGVFAGVLDSQTGTWHSGWVGRRSYMMDLRYALENRTTLDDVGAFMIAPTNEYTTNHLIFVSDPNTSKVIENNFSGNGTAMRRALRTAESELNDGVPWGIDNAIGCVNAFMLKGNHDNFTGAAFNTQRWETIRREILARGNVVTWEDLRAIATYHNENPGRQDHGDIYSGANQNIILFEPGTKRLEIFFKPKTGDLPDEPVLVPVPVVF